MCEKCKQIDVQIARCERLQSQITDKFFIDGLVGLIKGFLAEKIRPHPPELQRCAS